jgi:hypothetical protein
MPARNDNAGCAGEQARHLGAVPGDHRPVVRPQALVELAADGTDPAQVRRVEFPDGVHRLGQHVRLQPAGAAAALDHVDRLQRMIEAQQVHVLQFLEHPGQPALARGELRVALLHVEPPPVQAEVDVTGAEQLAQLPVVGLAFPPAGGDGGDRPLRRQRPGGRVQRGPALRPQQCHPHDA